MSLLFFRVLPGISTDSSPVNSVVLLLTAGMGVTPEDRGDIGMFVYASLKSSEF